MGTVLVQPFALTLNIVYKLNDSAVSINLSVAAELFLDGFRHDWGGQFFRIVWHGLPCVRK